MVDKGLGPSASEAGSEAMSLGVPPMSKAERLHRWADSLELQKQLQREANADAALGRRDGWCAMQTDSSPLTIAFEDWAFQAEGLRSDQLDDALAFFDLSEGEMQRITGSFYGSRTVPAALAARRVRALAQQAEATTAPQIGEPVAGSSVAPSLRNSARSSTAARGRREKGAAGAAPGGGEVVRRVRSAGAPSGPPARDYAPPLSW
jgi:hypothetical protein